MPISSGKQLGPYEILSFIAAGGMGEVYKAKDTRLNRMVAIKVLPSEFSEKAEFRQRFEREAQTIAGLNHPHICVLYDVGRHDGLDFLVMEFMEGETLAQRLERGSLPIEEVMKISVQIVDALDKAHRQGIVHRDLKPSNVMLTKAGAKLLDFGLAKSRPGGEASNSMLPTKADVTAQGTILGTLQYMAPEQLDGKEADVRTDIFAFGALIYEMVTAKKAFSGNGQASLISSIMSTHPEPLSQLQPMTPPLIDYVVTRCLAKDPEERWQNAYDLLTQLKWVVASGTQASITAPVSTRRSSRTMLPWALFAIAAILATLMAARTLLNVNRPQQSSITRFQITAPLITNPQLSVSPDGQWIAYVARTQSTTTGLFIRPMDSLEATVVPGSEGALHPFWSPDSHYIAFQASEKLKKVDIRDTKPQDVCDTGPGNALSPGTWNDRGIILLGSMSGLQKVAASGGQLSSVFSVESSDPSTAALGPVFLPDGRHFLYMGFESQQSSNVGIYLGSLESKERKLLIAVPSLPAYAEPGYLLFVRSGTLFAQPFDSTKLELRGESLPIVEGIGFNSITGHGSFAVSRSGTLIYRTNTGGGRSQFTWFDRLGKQVSLAGEAAEYQTSFDLSPNGKEIAAARETVKGTEIFSIDWTRNVTTQLTFTSRAHYDPIWSADGTQVIFDSSLQGNFDIFTQKESATSEETPLLATPNHEFPEDISKDGRYLAYASISRQRNDLYALPLFGDRKPIPIAESPFAKDEPHFSFDGKWIAYNSNESGQWQIYTTPFPSADQKRQISTTGGAQPRWRRDGKELYYLALDGKMMAVDITPGDKLESGIPHVLFDTGLVVDPIRDQYAVTPDGQRFLILKPISGGTLTPITVVLNWLASLPK